MDVIKQIEHTIATGNFAGAIELIEQQPQELKENSRQLMYSSAAARRLMGQPEKAIIDNNKLLEKFPEYGRAWLELAHCYADMGEHEKAASCYYNATQFNPALLTAWQFLERFYEVTKNQQALNFAQERIQWLTSLPEQLRGATDLFYEGDLVGAEMVCRNFLSMHNNHLEGMLLMAEIAMKNNANYEVELLLESCITSYPDNLRAGLVYGTAMNNMAEFQKAYDVCTRLETQHPDEYSLMLVKASACYGLGKLQESIDLCEEMIIQKPGVSFIRVLQGHCLKSLGRTEEAIQSYQKACQRQPDFGDAWWSLANTKTYVFSSEEIAQMQTIVETPSTTIDNRIHLDFALGKAHEHNKAYDQSFKYYQRGNHRKQTISPYVIEDFERTVEVYINAFNRPLFEGLASAGCNDSAPIFIVGLPRAGSTLLEQILASHSDVEGAGELHNIQKLVMRLKTNEAYPGNLHSFHADYFSRLGEQYISETQIYRSGAAHFIDKMPGNFLEVGLIKLFLPNAKVIDARRNPMDCGFSNFKQLFGKGHDFSYNLDSIARYYKAYEKMMTHWQEVLPGFVLTVQNEDIIEDLETQVHRILDFCQLPFEQNCLEFYNNKRSISTPSSEQVRQPVNRKGFNQWQPYEQYLGVLKAHFA